MPNAFDFTASPFDGLAPDEQRLVRDSVDIAYFPDDETILEPGTEVAHLYVIIKGHVSQFDGDELVATYGPSDCFDGRSLVAGRASSRFVAAEEVVAYQLAKEAVNELITRNATFGALLFSDLSNKLGALAQRHSQREMQALTQARVGEAFMRAAHVVDAAAPVATVAAEMYARYTSSILVRDEVDGRERMGIFTNTGLQRAVVDGRPLTTLPVREMSTFDLVTVTRDTPLYDALALMIQHQVHRLVVVDGAAVVGLLEQLDLLSFLSNHSYLITVQIVQAQDLSALAEAASRITRFVALLHRGGTRVAQIGRLVQALNAKLFERAWELVAPPELVKASCLFVMGSEGRGEQLLKTDQDNGLILRDGYAPPDDLAALCERFSQALAGFGYPPCPGRIMVSNPDWRKSATEFGQMTRQWLAMPTPDSLMNLAIFMDAHAVCGDARLLDDVRRGLMQLATDNDAMLGRFAAAVDAFAGGSGWWNRLINRGDSGELHLKKEGIFPLVHGVRSLALAHRVTETSTLARITALVADGRLSREMGAELGDSLQFFMGLRLKAGLAELETGKAVTGQVDAARLSSLDRDLLKDTLDVVKRFRAHLRQRFRLDAF